MAIYYLRFLFDIIMHKLELLLQVQNICQWYEKYEE